MTSILKRRPPPWVAAPLAGLASLALVAHQAPALALINESPSLPRGVYLRDRDQTPEKGDVVAIDPPPRARPYLSRLGMPSDGRLLKRVAAVGGDRVCREGRVVRMPGRAAVAHPHDRRGAPLPKWSGCRTLAADQLFLLGDTPASFDSRYFGPVRRSEIGGVYREILTW